MAFASLSLTGCVGKGLPPMKGSASGDNVSGATSIGSAAGAGAASAAAGAGAGAAVMQHTGAPMLSLTGDKHSHYPLVDGSSWVYHHTKPTKAPWDETDTLHAATYMGAPAAILEDEEDGQGVQTHSTLVVDGTGVYRAYKELTIANQVALAVSYDPAFLRFDEGWSERGQSVTLTDRWTQNCLLGGTSASNCTTGTHVPGMTTHVFTVVDPSATVTVPAGTFVAVEFQRVDPATMETKLFWFAPGVGKVREETPATMAVEELTSYQIP